MYLKRGCADSLFFAVDKSELIYYNNIVSNFLYYYGGDLLC
jgi:hypothetical protein